MGKFRTGLIALAAMLFITSAQTVWAKDWHKGRTITITITNLTRGQIFSPPVAVVHDSSFKLFELGAPADPSLASLAEDGQTDPLTSDFDEMGSVFDHKVAAGPVLPGQSVSVELTARGRYRFVSLAGMLVTTNDAFFAVQGVPVNFFRVRSATAEAYDAGSEFNSEDCGYIPGPPCGSGGVRDTDGAEGYVYIHGGIHGGVDLDPATADWRNPVAKIMISPGK
ncbi:spondin domain-containing protein [Desulfospira joergensenii]|uniref:spondin domain-containing protein n=1 Tax=Desulfospira joergensenii TaxID=53329 RepID=UPI0003B49A42|nr:spondin domain-containing protein [Desulfospira joergensenii]